MPQFVTSVKTSMSREEAFDYMTDLRNLPDWDPGVSSAEKIGAGEVEKGSAFDVVASGAKLTYVVIEFDRPARAIVEADGPRLRSYDVITIEPAADGSIVTWDATLELKGIFRAFSPVLALMFDRIGAKAEAGLQSTLPDAVKVS
jgi:carbon monoxide dehydrogenase subunit G